MTKPKLEAKLLNIIRHYKILNDTLDQANYMVKKQNLSMAHDFINIALYRLEQTQIELETTLREIELTRKINNQHDTRPNE